MFIVLRKGIAHAFVCFFRIVWQILGSGGGNRGRARSGAESIEVGRRTSRWTAQGTAWRRGRRQCRLRHLH